MEREQIECVVCGSTKGAELRAGRGMMWLCDRCDAEFSRQCRRMEIVLPDDLDEQIAAMTTDDPSDEERADHTSIETALSDVRDVGPDTIENIKSHGFETAEELRTASPAALQQVAGIGDELATRILEHIAATDPNEESEESEDTDDSGLGDLFG